MIQLRRSVLIEKLKLQPVENYSGYRNLVNDAMNGEGDQAMAFLVKRGEISFPEEQLRAELNFMVEDSLLTILQWEKMLALLDNAENGKERILNFLRKKRRIVVV